MLTAIWQSDDNRENDWISELFGAHISEHIYDGKHELVQDDCIVLDKFIHKQPLSYFKQFKNRRNVFLFHLSDEHYHGGYDAYRFFNGVFRTYRSSVFKSSVMQLPLGYSNGVRLSAPPKPASERAYTWSFLGETVRASRPEMVKALAGVEPHYRHSTDDGLQPVFTPTAYSTILEDSVFAPSPMGRLNLECYRTYEALQCGCIPIVEKRTTLDFYKGVLGPNPLITVRNWDQAAGIMQDLSASPARLNALQAEIGTWWKETKQRLTSEITKTLLFGMDQPKSDRPRTRFYYHAPLWQQVELARHHSVGAFLRRAKLESLRLLIPSYTRGSAK